MLCDTTFSSRFAENIHKRDQQNFMTFLYNCEINKTIVLFMSAAVIQYSLKKQETFNFILHPVNLISN